MATLNELLDIATKRMLTEQEHTELLIQLRSDSAGVLQLFINGFSSLDEPQSMDPKTAEFLLEAIASVKVYRENKKTEPIHRVHFLKAAWFRYAAAVLLLLTSLSLYYIFSHTSQPRTGITSFEGALPKADVLPGYDRAVLTLSNGQKIELDSASSETIQDGTLSIKNDNGQLIYRSLPASSMKGTAQTNGNKGNGLTTDAGIGYNTMTTPKGGQFQLTLSDGTHVWLNATSSITYPTYFAKNNREVTITGEVYFEVKANKSRPFIVKTGTEQIIALGTSFNVNAYEDEPYLKASLLEGSIKIGDTFIKPGQAYRNGKVMATDIKQDLAWKNGAFWFDNTDVSVLLRQLSRWYDVEIQYPDGPVKKNISGSMGRDLTLSQVLRVLKGLGINGRIERRKLIITK